MRGIFLDRDGVICKNRSDYVKSWEEFQFLPGAKDSLVKLAKLGLPIIVITNQSAIGRKIISASTVEDIHRRMVAEIESCGGRIDKVLYCPHQPDDECNCRKPEPGMLQQAASEMKLDLCNSYMVGDATSDLIAGLRVGCHTFLVLTGRGVEQLVSAYRMTDGQFTLAINLEEAASQISDIERQYKYASPQPSKLVNCMS